MESTGSRKRRFLIVGVLIGFLLGISIPIAQSMAVIGIDFATSCPSSPQQFAINESAPGAFGCTRVPYSSLTGAPTINNESATACTPGQYGVNETLPGAFQCALSPNNAGIDYIHLFQYLPFDEFGISGVQPSSALDISSDGLNAALENGAREQFPGRCGIFQGCMILNSSNSNYLLSSTALITEVDSAFTFSTWFNDTALTSTEQVILGGSTASAANGFSIGVNNACVNVTLGDGTTGHNYIEKFTFTNKKWYFLDVQWFNPALVIYANQTQIGSNTTFTGNIGISGLAEYDIGRYAGGNAGGKYFNGLLDDYRVYNTGKSALWNYQEFFSSPSPEELFFSQTGLGFYDVTYTNNTQLNTKATTLHQAGYKISFTPQSTSALFFAQVNVQTSVTGAYIAFQMDFGTGAAPGFNTTQTGTLIGSTGTVQPQAANFLDNGALVGSVTGLTPGTTYWFDLTWKGVGTASASIVSSSIDLIQGTVP